MVFEQLRESTKEQHLKIKNGKYANKIMRGELSLVEYHILIIANYYFHGTLEKKIFEQVPTSFLRAIDFKSRSKVQYIIEDLLQLGIAPNNLMSKAALKKLPTINIDTEPKALAALYVAEGTAIGGAIIKKSLLKHTNLSHLNFSFYGCYGNMLSKKWKSFAKHFNERCEREQISEAVIDSTASVFDYYEQLLSYFENLLVEKKIKKKLNKNPMVFNLQSQANNTKLVVLTWDKLPTKKEINSDVDRLNGLISEGGDYHILMNFLSLGQDFNRKSKHMWEVTRLLDALHYKQIKKIGVTVPKKTAGQVLVKQMLSEVVEDDKINTGFFDTLQECTLWSAE